MSRKTNWYGTKVLVKYINGVKVYLFYSWDLTHGTGWFCHAVKHFNYGYGFSKNKFTAVRQAVHNSKALPFP